VINQREIMNFTLLCGTLLVAVTGQHADLSDSTKASQNWGLLYADHVFLAATDEPGVYENEIGIRLKIASDHSRIWLNNDHGAGLRCKERKSPQASYKSFS
jgi:hypothetical protein